MSEAVKGRLWPAKYPFSRVMDGGFPMERNGFVFDPRNGDFQFRDAKDKPTTRAEDVVSMSFLCPQSGATPKYCGSIRVGLTKPTHEPSWAWNGNFEEPNLTPSVNCQGCECKWHGHLNNGTWKSC
jgi:hypothetical protein